jgi:hypothetical protein
MYSVMAILKSSVVWGLFEYTESGAQRLFYHPVYYVMVSPLMVVCVPVDEFYGKLECTSYKKEFEVCVTVHHNHKVNEYPT